MCVHIQEIQYVYLYTEVLHEQFVDFCWLCKMSCAHPCQWDTMLQKWPLLLLFISHVLTCDSKNNNKTQSIMLTTKSKMEIFSWQKHIPSPKPGSIPTEKSQNKPQAQFINWTQLVKADEDRQRKSNLHGKSKLQQQTYLITKDADLKPIHQS